MSRGQPVLWWRSCYFSWAVEAYTYNRQEPLLFAHGGYGRFLTADDVSATPKS